MTLKKKNNIIILIIILEVFLYSNYLFRPYDTAGQESLISFFAHQAAMSNWIREDFNIFITKILECDGEITFLSEVSNWPNGFFYIFSFIIKIFGNFEIVGRVFAIFLNLTGMILFISIFSKKEKTNYILFSIPLIIATPLGLSSLNVVYPDSMMILLISILIILTNSLFFYSIFLLISPLFFHIVLIYNIVHVIFLRLTNKISSKKFFLLFSLLIFSLFYLFYVLMVNETGFELRKLYEKFIVRSFLANLFNFTSDQHEIGTNVNFYHRTYMFYSIIRDNLGYISFPFIAVGLINEFKKRTLLFFIFLTSVFTSYILLQYYIIHYYANLFFLFLIIIFCLIGINIFLDNFGIKKYNFIIFICLIILNISLLKENLIYQKWGPVIKDSNKFQNFIRTGIDGNVNKFEIKNYNSDARICGFYLLPIIIENYQKTENEQILDLNLF